MEFERISKRLTRLCTALQVRPWRSHWLLLILLLQARSNLQAGQCGNVRCMRRCSCIFANKDMLVLATRSKQNPFIDLTGFVRGTATRFESAENDTISGPVNAVDLSILRFSNSPLG